MLIDRGYQRLFLSIKEIVYNVAGGGGTNVIIESPCHPNRHFNLSDKIDHIVICHCFQFLRLVHPLKFGEEMRITTCASGFVSGHIAQCGVVCGASCDPFVECGGYQCQCTSLTPSLG